jgi:large subunit ribosomal protein L18
MRTKSKLKMQKWELKRKRLKYHLKQKNINNIPRLVVFSSNNNIFTQLVDDANSNTILSVSSIDKELKVAIDKAKSKIEKSTIVGKTIAEKMKKANIKKIIFDRNGYKYHGRVKAVGEAIRSSEIQI